MKRRAGNAASVLGMAMAAARQSTHVWHPPMRRAGICLFLYGSLSSARRPQA